MSSRPLRIAYVVHSFEMGGLERVVAHLVNHLDPGRFSPLLICLDRKGSAGDWLRREGVPVIELHKPCGNSPGIAAPLARAFRENRVDLVHSHNWGTLVETVLACRRTKAVHVHAEHSLALDEFRVRGWRRTLRRLAMRWVLRRVEAVVGIARAVERWLVDECGVARSRLHYIPNGVERPPATTTDNRGHRRQLGLGNEAVVFGSVGRLVELKDFAAAIQATAGLARQGHNAHLVLVGEGPERERLEQVALAAGVAARVHLVGRRSDVGAWLDAFDVYVNTSRTEAMNMGILEAMSARLPVVATGVGDAAALLEGPAPAGLVVPPANPPALTRAMGRLLTDWALRRELADNGYRRHLAEYSVPRMVQRYSGLYTELAG